MQTWAVYYRYKVKSRPFLVLLVLALTCNDTIAAGTLAMDDVKARWAEPVAGNSRAGAPQGEPDNYDRQQADTGQSETGKKKKQLKETGNKAKQYAGEMILIPGGTFRMGDLNDAGDDDERPVHSVTVPTFKLGKYEVTFAQWDACVADGGCGGYLPDDYSWGRGNRPVMNVSWDDAWLFIDWLNSKTGANFRLPTEAEWEYAGRAGSETLYSWGDDIHQNLANCWSGHCGD